MAAKPDRAVIRAAHILGAAALAALAAGCGEERKKEIVIEFPSPERCLLLGEEMAAGRLGARLAKAQDRSPAFDTMDFRIVMAAGMPEEDYKAIERDARDVIRSLGAGNKVTAERQASLVARMLSSFWFWAMVIVVVAGGYLGVKVKRA